LTTYDIGAEEDQGQLGVLASLAEQVSATEESEEPETEATPAEPVSEEDDDDEDDDDNMGVVLGGVGAGLGALALILSLVALRRKP
jgi:hypothetical protein